MWGITPFAAVAVSVPNYRSLGGIKCGDRVVRHNTILRSATPSNATAADVAYLRGTLQLASVVDLRAPEEALKDPGARRLPEKVDHVYHSIFDEFMLREGLQRKLLRSPLLLAVTGLLGLLRKLPARTGRLRARLEATRERKLASLLDRLALSDVYWWMLVRRAQFWLTSSHVTLIAARPSAQFWAQFWRNSLIRISTSSRHRRDAAMSSARCSSSARRRRRSSSTARTARTAPVS